MYAYSKQEFWNAMASRPEMYVEVTNPSLVRLILFEHYLFKTLGIVFLVIAILTSFSIFHLDQILKVFPNYAFQSFDQTFMNSYYATEPYFTTWSQLLSVFPYLAVYFSLILTSSLVSRFFSNKSIQGNLSVCADGSKLTVRLPGRTSYYSRCLRMVFE